MAVNEIFVFGSNLDGRHGKGAALWAKRTHGAIEGQAEGLQGESYAIPTKGHMQANHYLPILPVVVIQAHVTIFELFAAGNPHLTFVLTPIGCGHAGYVPHEIAPLFSASWHLPNILFPPEFVDVLSYKAGAR